MLKLLKAIYGTKQGGREWYLMIDSYLKSIGFKPNKVDNCFYTLIIGDDYVILLLYVDDIIIAATTEAFEKEYSRKIGTKFKTSYNGKLKEYLNIAIAQNIEERTIHMSQEKYITTFIEQHQIPIDETIDTPLMPNAVIKKFEEENLNESQISYINEYPYKEVIGCLLYVCICTMPMIAYAISVLSKFSNDPSHSACKALTRLAKFVYNKRKVGLTLGGGPPHIVGFSDSDFAGDIVTRRSRSGSINFIANGPICWYSKMQACITNSTMEAEFVALCPAVQNNNYMRNILQNTHIPALQYKYATTIYGDNDASLAVAERPVHHQKTKHIDIKYKYTCEQIDIKNIVVDRVSSEYNISDPFTKNVTPTVFKRHEPTMCGLGNIKRSSKREVTKKNDHIDCPRCAYSLAMQEAAVEEEY